jgi:capsular exopolysaccharide synthesis family protein
MGRISSILDTAYSTSKRVPAPHEEASDLVCQEATLSQLDEETTEPVMGEQVLTDGGDKSEWYVRGRREKTRPEGAANAQKSIDERLVALHHCDTADAEQYHALYTAIAQVRRVQALRTLLITSALAGEGKSLGALNLAITTAATQNQHSVVLVDTDLRKPSVHSYLGINPVCGLTDYLLGQVEYSQIFFETQVPGLTIVPAGRKVSNPTALIHSERMEQFFQHTKAQMQYSYIIVDSSPVLLTSEPKALLQHVDTSILVVHARKTPAKVVLQAIKILGKENLLGCVLNGSTSTDFSFSHHYYGKNY